MHLFFLHSMSYPMLKRKSQFYGDLWGFMEFYGDFELCRHNKIKKDNRATSVQSSVNFF